VIDTETFGTNEDKDGALDPITCKLLGFSLYTPGQKAIYVPINHCSYVTYQRLQNQPTERDVKPYLEKLSNTALIMHNAKFDTRVIKNTCGVKLKCYWDTMLGSKLMDEKESAALKYQYGKVFENKDKKEYDFDKLFGGLENKIIPIDLMYTYGAMDSYKTYKLYEYQLDWFNLPENSGPKNIMLNIEMKVLPCVADMEDYGVCIDKDFGKQISVKYHELAQEAEKQVYDEMRKYDNLIESYKLANPKHKLSDPISITSPTQLAILFYDILKIQPPDERNPRGTGEEILSKIDNPVCKCILEYREYLKLLSTYVDAIPLQVKEKTGRLHASFNQYGADTGRFSSNSPNLQNIPAKKKDGSKIDPKEIREMFIASPGYTFVGGDFSLRKVG
jgi:DNA polymerase I-like protein with 3'-5' exonuclease and polymerase domains